MLKKELLSVADSRAAAGFGDEVNIQIPIEAGDWPVVIESVSCDNSLEWFHEHSASINSLLLKYGAVLLRGFEIGSPQGFDLHFRALGGDPIDYKNRTSPRNEVVGNIYTSTTHPKDQVIHMHTENSYSNVYNRIIAFFCLIPSAVGGETPIADERKLLKFLSEETKQKFREKGVKYLRNTVPGVGLDWRTIYQTDDVEVVNKKLREEGVEFKWVDKDHLRVQTILPAFQNHPILNEEMWFNHMYFGHKSLFDPIVAEFFGDENLPFVTSFGDGSEIDDATIQEFKDFYAQHSIVFKWEKDDFLLLDNMMFSHGRNPFEGERKILTAMSQPYSFVR